MLIPLEVEYICGKYPKHLYSSFALLGLVPTTLCQVTLLLCMDAAKRAGRVNYSIQFRLPSGKLVKRSLKKEGLDPKSIKDARDANAKYVEKKRENKLFDISPDTEMTFNDLSKWYLDQEPVKKLASFDIIAMKLKIFNAVYGDKIVADIKKVDLQNYLIKREKEGKKISTLVPLIRILARSRP